MMAKAKTVRSAGLNALIFVMKPNRVQLQELTTSQDATTSAQVAIRSRVAASSSVTNAKPEESQTSKKDHPFSCRRWQSKET